MKNQNADRQIPSSCTCAMPYSYKYPELDLTSKSPDAAFEKAFPPCADEPCEYALDTSTWDS